MNLASRLGPHERPTRCFIGPADLVATVQGRAPPVEGFETVSPVCPTQVTGTPCMACMLKCCNDSVRVREFAGGVEEFVVERQRYWVPRLMRLAIRFAILAICAFACMPLSHEPLYRFQVVFS